MSPLTELSRIMERSRDYDRLLHTWEEWREASGAAMPRSYQQFVQLANEAAQANSERYSERVVVDREW